MTHAAARLGSVCMLVFAITPAVAQEIRGSGNTEEALADEREGWTQADTSPPEQAAAEGRLTEIIVTARRVSENLQSVPVAVTAFSSADLQQQSATRLSDVARLTPGLSIRPGRDSSASTTFSLRGQYQSAVTTPVDASIGVYVDGYYWARAFGVDADLLDVSSVQVLKGPQGTLFGRNTTGGAILLQTNDPDFRGVSGLVSGGYGSYNRRAGTAIVNLPLVDDRLAVRVALRIDRRDGFVTETTAGAKLGDVDSISGRAKLLFKPAGNLSFLLSAELFRTDSLSNPFRAAYVSPTSVANLVAGFERFGAPGAGGIGQRFGQGASLISDYVTRARDSDDVSLNLLPVGYAKTQTYTGTATLETFFGAAKFIGGYRHLDSRSQIDLDGTPFNVLDTFGRQGISQYSGELQITGKARDNKIDFAGGLFYFRESGSEQAGLTALPALNPDNPTLFDGDVTTDSMGMYGQVSLRLTDRFSVTGGLRYSIEEKGIVTRNIAFSAAAGGTACLLASASLPACRLARRDSFAGVSYLIGADYKITPDVLVYAKASSGFRSGGQNLFSAGSLVAFTPFQPERVTAYEAGLKSEFLDRRVRLNLAGYYNTTSDLQRSTIVTSSNGQSAIVVGNAGKARFSGAETELSALLFKGFTLGATASYIAPKYLSYVDPNSGADRSGEFFENVPKFTGTLSASYARDFGGIGGLVRVDYVHTGTVYLQPTNNPTDPFNAQRIAQYRVDPTNILNARVSATIADGALDLAVFVTNLTNSRDTILANGFAEPIGIIPIVRREPRMFGGTASFRFGRR